MNYKTKYLVIFVIVYFACFAFTNFAPSTFGDNIEVPKVVTYISYFFYGFSFAFLTIFAYLIHFLGIKEFMIENNVIFFISGLLFYAFLGWLIGLLVQFKNKSRGKQKQGI